MEDNTLNLRACADDTPIVQALVQLAKAADAAAADDAGGAGCETAAGSTQQQALQLLQAAVADCLAPSEYGETFSVAMQPCVSPMHRCKIFRLNVDMLFVVLWS